ncbi:disulfide isomerase [Niveomyces insectorum RCEF 264]|uniref:protein disulfide-isomerase n=1 Tax=Niveomyces insectorum RCEF 264 TaxID=1081102 RepID=A0A167VPU7_9HYPO|nr:disulfide isomerase [Niveomyces insectorum RCEF 264]
MHTSASLAACAAALLATLPAVHAGLYAKSSPVLQVTGQTYNRLVEKSNHTTIVEFFAPWCGHCQNLKPSYEKAARNLAGLAHVAAVDCDDDANKPLCGRMGVQGFPTLKIVRPAKVAGRTPVVEDYQGPRTATGIVEAVLGHLNNHVQTVTDKNADAFLAGEGPKALLFTDKGTVSPLLKSIAIDYLGVLAVGQIRNKEAATVAKFNVETFPTLVLFPGGDQDPIVYDGGAFKREPIVEFLSRVAAPNPDPAPSTADKKKDNHAKSKAKTSSKKAKKDEASSTTDDAETETSSTATEESATATDEQTAPVIVESALPIPTIHTAEKLHKECLHAKAHTCVLAFVPASDAADKADAEAAGQHQALDNLAALAHKHAQSNRHLFPFFVVPTSNPAAASVLEALGLTVGDGEVQLVAVNARRGWWRHYEAADGENKYSHEALESWIDAIRMGEGEKKKLPEELVVAVEAETEAPSEPVSETVSEAVPEATPEATPEAASEDEAEATPASSATESSADATESVSEAATESAKAEEIKHEEL